MGIPVLPVPDTRPGYSHQVPGTGDAFAQGIQQLVAALINARKMKQDDRQLDLQAARDQQNATYQNAQIANLTADNERQLMQFLTGQQNAANIGQGLGMIGQPGMGTVNIPGGLPAQLPVGNPMGVEEVLPSIAPQNRAEFLSKAEPLAKAAREKKAAADKTRAQDEFVRRLPKELQTMGQLSVLAEQGGVSKEVADLLFKQAATAIDPKVLVEIDAKHPEWQFLDPAGKMTLYLDFEKQRNQLRNRPPEQGAGGSGRALPATAATSIADAQALIDATRSAIDAFKTATGDNITGGVVGRAAGVLGQFGVQVGGALGTVARSRLSNVRTSLSKLRSGTAVSAQEFLQLQDMLPLKTDDEAVVLAKLDELGRHFGQLMLRKLDAFQQTGYDVSALRASFASPTPNVKGDAMEAVVKGRRP